MIDKSNLRQILQSSEWLNSPFDVLSDISRVASVDETTGREFVIRALDSRNHLSESYKNILQELAVNVGLYPYVEQLNPLSLRSSIIHASHRAEGVMDDYVLHSSQAEVLRYLVDGSSVVLSAPTSFGKSLLIDILISSKDFKNVVLIVPTLALVEETRRRMARFSERYSIITSSNQTYGNNNIFVLTQERFLSLEEDLPSIDFFAIDEFYKLSITEEGNRATHLNQALLKLVKTGAQFYMLGPSIRAIPDFAEERLNCKFLIKDFQTVAIELHALTKNPSKVESLATLLDTIDGSTMVYCQSPASTRKLLKQYLEIREISLTENPELIEASEWTSANYHSEWLVSKALMHGIGIHHGKLPRALGRFMIRAFEEKILQILLCTSTLIEGVNTAAKNVVVFDSKIGGNRQPLDFFTFNNIRGRSGRMFKHFIGHVFYFDTPPQEELPFVDVPAINPTKLTPSSLLIQMDEASIPDELMEKYKSLVRNTMIPVDMLRNISSIEPEYLISTAEYLHSLTTQQLRKFIWSTRPVYGDIKITSDIIWEQMGGNSAAKKSALYSSSMMTFWIWSLYKSRSVAKFRREMIISQINKNGKADEAVENVLSFLRGWASFNYPKYLTALSDVVSIVLKARGFEECNYYPFAVSIEHLFQPTSFSTLEEYGLPAEISEQLLSQRLFNKDDDINKVISALKKVDLKDHADGIFERKILEDFQEGIGVKS